MTVTDDPMLAVFVDRWTMQHARVYPHPIERVWEAVSTSEHLDVWLMPVARVNAHVGGRAAFSWGGPEARSIVGSVTECDPPHVIQYTFGHPRSFLRFELTEETSGTRLVFTQSFRPGESTDRNPEDPGGDLPGGEGTPWRPGFVQGFHRMLDDLPRYLDGDLTLDERVAGIAAGYDDVDLGWIETYLCHIRRT